MNNCDTNDIVIEQQAEKPIKNDIIETIESFDQLNLRDLLLQGIYTYGFKHPSEVQQKSLRSCVSGENVIIQSTSGTGKTATYIIAILQQINLDCKDCQALILMPTRELAQAIHCMILSIGKRMDVTCHACVGGVSIREDIKYLEKGVQIVVGTPGRISDMFRRSILHSNKIKIFILDDADEILSRGFHEQIYDILMKLPTDFQSIVLSNTMTNELLELTQKFVINPKTILIKNVELKMDGLNQYYVDIEREEWKLETLYELFDMLTTHQIIVYCNKCEKVDWLTEKVCERNYKVSSLHREMDITQRNDAVEKFRIGSIQIMIRTDRAGVAMDVSQVSLVINYDLQIYIDQYLNRIGYCGEFRRKKTIINFIVKGEERT
ncbi:hypothetical protein I4U23_031124 [Adineta vaga]|nr:hypothetical protein I4U23_031124 [Adineta vaga]